MASQLASYAAKKALGKQMDKYSKKKTAGQNDPFFEDIPLPNGKTKKVRKQIPDWIPEHDAKLLEKAKTWAYRWDLGLFDFANVRFGWGSAVGFIPVIGDFGDMIMALYIWNLCTSVNANMSFSTKLNMLRRVVQDFLIGLIPFIGDFADAAYKCNTKNVARLEEILLDEYAPKDMEEKDKRKSRLEDMNDQPAQTFNEKDSVGEHARRTEEPVRKSQKGSGGRQWYGGNDRTHRDNIETGTHQSTRDTRRPRRH